MITQRILIMGLPGAGKTYLANNLKTYFEAAGKTVTWFNADEVRKANDDWDFTVEGRIRQSKRMRDLADTCGTDYAMCDFVAPLVAMRTEFAPDWLVWVDTIDEGRFADTNKMFVKPIKYDFRIPRKEDVWCEHVGSKILNNEKAPTFDWTLPTVQMLGRWQPWHEGHQALFKRALAKTGQVCIMIRDCQGWEGSNPFATDDVKDRIRRDLDPLYQGRYEIIFVPNIVNITYGRKVGYAIEQESFDAAIEEVSATKIREKMKTEGKL